MPAWYQKVRFRFRKHRIRWYIVSGVMVVLVSAVVLMPHFLNEGLRRGMEHEMNRHLKGYTARVGSVKLHPLSFSLDVIDWTISQNAHPDPPVWHVPRLRASVHWAQLFRGRAVGVFSLYNPKLYVHLTNIREEEKSRVPLKKKGWPEALQSIYPLKINIFTATNGEIVYIDKDPNRPLRLSQVYLQADNIRNIYSAEHAYPSPVKGSAVVFDKGKLRVDGGANFLAGPHAGVKANLTLDNMDLSYFKPITERYQLVVKKGTVSAKGEVEYAPKTQAVHLSNVMLNEPVVEYIHHAWTAPEEQKRGRSAVRQTTGAAGKKNPPEIRIDTLSVRNGEFGYFNDSKNPPYLIFFDHMEVALQNFSNHFAAGAANILLTGKFMGSGDTQASGTFRPETHGPDFNIKIAIENTRLQSMNDLLRTYGNFDVEAGLFSFHAELTVKDERIQGYIKPLFRDIKVGKKGEKKSLARRIYEGVAGGLSKLLENPRGTVATEAPAAGPVKNPRADTWEVIANLLENAFFKSILPGFESEISRK